MSTTREVLGLTLESLLVFGGLGLCLAGFAFFTSDNLLLGDLFFVAGFASLGVGLWRDFRKKDLKIMHWIGNGLVILFSLIFLYAFIMGNISKFS